MTSTKDFNCTVTYDEDREKLFSLDLDISTNSDDVDKEVLKEMLSEMIKSSFDEGVGNLIYMMKNVSKQEKK